MQQIFSFEGVITMTSEKLDQFQSNQLTLCAQVKVLRASLPLQRRQLSRWVQQVHVDVVRAKRNGLCPCCQETKIIGENGRLPGAEYDHWYSRNRARAEETWLVCEPCNSNLKRPEFKAGSRSAFESYQLALRRFLQSRQGMVETGKHPFGAA